MKASLMSSVIMFTGINVKKKVKAKLFLMRVLFNKNLLILVIYQEEKKETKFNASMRLTMRANLKILFM